MKKIVFIFLIILSSNNYSAQIPYEGITKVVWTPGASDIYLSDDSATSGKNGGISPLNNSDMSYSNTPLRAVGEITGHSLSRARLTLSSQQGYSGVSKGKLYTYYDNKKVARTEALDPTPISLGGYYLVLLNPFSKAVTQKPYLATAEGKGLYYLVDDDTIVALQSAIKNKCQFSICGFKYTPENQIMTKVGNANKNEYGELPASDYLKVYQVTLTKYGIRSESVIFLQDKTGRYGPAILVSYGTKGLAYAMYGVWHDDTRAQEFGFKKDQRIYFSEKQLLPDDETYKKYPNIALLEIAPAMRYGKQVFSEEEILKDKEKYYSLLAWRSIPAYSEMQRTYDPKCPQDSVVAKVPGLDDYPPNWPDNTENTNGIGMTDCADQDWYWDLFCQCADAKLNAGKEENLDSKNFQDYKDYLGTSAMNQQYDPTVYGMDGSSSPQTIETENQPVDPSIYNKDCKLLNGKDVVIYDPFAADASFSLSKRYTKYSFDKWGTFSKGHNVSDKFKKCLSDLQNVYDYYITNKGKETSWGYPNNKKKWPYDGDIEINITKPEYLDSAWYIGDAMANYEAFENFRTFAVYDDYTASGYGGPFLLIQNYCSQRDGDIKDKPEYLRLKKYSVEWKPGEDVVDYKKDWYIQWSYNLVVKDKWDRKISIGTLIFTSSLWKNENEQVWPAGWGFNDRFMNISVGIGGKTPFKGPSKGYDNKSKDYRTDQTDAADRSPDAEIDKGEAIWEIVRKIAIAELPELATKTVHYISQRNDQYGVAATAVYEASKRLENSLMIRKTCEMAKDMYKGYVFWKQTMDIIKDCRDTYNSISSAWDGLRTSTQNLFDYYKNLDFKSIRLTNITCLIPSSYLYSVDYSLGTLQYSLSDFNKSVDALAFQSDRLTRGNYGPFNPVIIAVTNGLKQATAQSGETTTKFLDNTASALNEVHKGAGNNIANKAYLSNITKATYNAITNQRLSVMNERTRAASLGLFIMQREARDWVTYSNYMRYAAGNTVDWSKKAANNNFTPIIDGFQPPNGMFRDQSYFESLAKTEGTTTK